MPAMASLEDVKAARKDLLEAKNPDDLRTAFKSGAASGGKILVS